MNFKLVIQFLLLLSFYHGGFTNELYLSCGDHGFDDIACMFSVNTTYQITHTTVYFWHEGITNDDISIIVPHYSFDDEIFAPNIPSFLCDTFKNLKYIRFYQGVKAINVNTFKNCHNIEYIYIGRNELRELPKNAFVNQQNLKTLYINNNSISILHSNSFGLLSNLRTIDFSSNNIDAIDERIFDNTGTREIHANNNPCVDSSLSHIIDTSHNKSLIRTALKNCFDNYIKYFKDCNFEKSIDERVCKIEREYINSNNINEELIVMANYTDIQIKNISANINDLYFNNIRMNTTIKNLSIENNERKAEIEEIQNEIEKLTEELENLKFLISNSISSASKWQIQRKLTLILFLFIFRDSLY